MDELKLCESDYRFMRIIWDNEPLSSRALVDLCAQKLGWKKSTTYTVLKKLCERGLFQTENSTVTAKLSREEFYSIQSEKFVEETFEGSLPAFLAAFTKRQDVSDTDLDELQAMIDRARKGGGK